MKSFWDIMGALIAFFIFCLYIGLLASSSSRNRYYGGGYYSSKRRRYSGYRGKSPWKSNRKNVNLTLSVENAELEMPAHPVFSSGQSQQNEQPDLSSSPIQTSATNIHQSKRNRLGFWSFIRMIKQDVLSFVNQVVLGRIDDSPKQKNLEIVDSQSTIEVIAQSLREGGQQPIQKDPLPSPVVDDPAAVDVITRAPIGPVDVKQIHRQMQSEIVKCLQEQMPVGRDVYIELNGIDIFVDDLIEVSIIEIKTGSDCVLILREAIGQLLEYQFFALKNFTGRKTRLIAVSPLLIDERALFYLNHLKTTYHLDIEYLQYTPGSYSFAI